MPKDDTIPDAPRRQRPPTWTILSLGFRPFFLFAGLWAAIGLPVSILMMEGALDAPGAAGVLAWHRHELIFGYVAATIVGFMLTAVPNWTGRLPVCGAPLGALALLWLAGRIAVSSAGFIGAVATAAVDLSFLAAIVALALREIVAGRNWRNLPIVGALALLLCANALQHAENASLVANDAIAGGAGTRLAIATVTALIALIGGRIVPSFTRNWIVKNEAGPPPAPFGGIDRATLALTAIALVLWVVLPESAVTGAVAALAALAHLARLIRWRGHATLRDPLVWVLHLAYLWLAVGLGLIGAAAFLPGLSMSAALHGLTIGAIGSMTLAVMSRATLGHTGRALRAGPVLTTSYLLVTAAAVARILSAFVDGNAIALRHLAAGCWTVAFLLFAIVCGPMLVRRRADGKPG